MGLGMNRFLLDEIIRAEGGGGGGGGGGAPTGAAGGALTGAYPNPALAIGVATGTALGTDVLTTSSNFAGAISGTSAAIGLGVGVVGATNLAGGAATGAALGSDVELIARKNAASGYAGLDGSSLVLAARLGTGSATASTALFGDRTYKAAALAVHTHSVPVLLGSYSWDNPTGADIKGVGFSIGANTITDIRAIRTGGTAAAINVRTSGTTTILSSDLAVNTSFTHTTTIATPALADTNRIEIMLQSMAGAVTRLEVYVLGTRSVT